MHTMGQSPARKNPMAESGIEPEPPWFVASNANHKTKRVDFSVLLPFKYSWFGHHIGATCYVGIIRMSDMAIYANT